MVEKKLKHTRSEKDSFKVKINVDGDEVSVECFLNEWNFNELDKWIRSRFGLKADEPLRYMDNLGAGNEFNINIGDLVNFYYF